MIPDESNKKNELNIVFISYFVIVPFWEDTNNCLSFLEQRLFYPRKQSSFEK